MAIKVVFFNILFLLSSYYASSQLDTSSMFINIDKSMTLSLQEFSNIDTLLIRSYDGIVPHFKVGSNLSVGILSFEIGDRSLSKLLDHLNIDNLVCQTITYSGQEQDMLIHTKVNKLFLEISKIGLLHPKLSISKGSRINFLSLYGVKVTNKLLSELNEIEAFETLEIGHSCKMKITTKNLRKMALKYEIILMNTPNINNHK